jgi:hypothetical protein
LPSPSKLSSLKRVVSFDDTPCRLEFELMPSKLERHAGHDDARPLQRTHADAGILLVARDDPEHLEPKFGELVLLFAIRNYGLPRVADEFPAVPRRHGATPARGTLATHRPHRRLRTGQLHVEVIPRSDRRRMARALVRTGGWNRQRGRRRAPIPGYRMADSARRNSVGTRLPSGAAGLRPSPIGVETSGQNSQ